MNEYALIYLIGAALVIGLWAWVMYSIIRNASKADLIFRTNKINMQLLSEIALKLGVNPERVKKIFEEGQK